MLHREVTARLEAWRLLLFIICLENQGNDSSNEHAELKNPFPCNIHTCHELRSDCHRQSFYFYSLRDAPPHSFTIGGKKKYNHPRKKSRGTAYRGTTGSTGNSISQDSTDCKENSGQRCAKVSHTAKCPGGAVSAPPGPLLYFFTKSASVTLSKYPLMRLSSSLQTGSVGQPAARGQVFAPHSRQATGARDPSVSRRISPSVYSPGSRLRR